MNLRRLRALSDYLTSAALCDVLDALGIVGHIEGMVPNWSHAGFLGRAKTLRLRELEEDEEPKGIYGALKSYELISENDVIVVEMERDDCAYFGELNAILAKQRGAAGAVIGGMTRDVAATARMRFPVFAFGNTSSDCKGKLTLDSIGGTVRPGGVRVAPGDLVFADPAGVVVISTQLEYDVIERAVKAIAKEGRIRRALLDEPIEDVMKQYGTF